jgi:hypothetical protein
VKEYGYQEHDSEVTFRFPTMARKPTSDFMAQLPAMIPMNSELNLVSFWNTMQDSEYKCQTEIQYPINTTWFRSQNTQG